MKIKNVFLFLVILIACAGVSTSESVIYTPQTYWKINTDAGINASAACSNGIIYFNNNDGYTFAVDSNSGAMDWTYETGAKESSPIYDENTLYVTGKIVTYYEGGKSVGGGKIYAFNASTGILKWSSEGILAYKSTPTIYNNMLYVGGSKIYAIDSTTGTLRWNYDAVSESSPAAFNGIIYVGLDNGNISALNADTGSLLWNYQTDGMVKSSPTVVNNVVYVGSQDKSLYALNASTGNLIWKYNTDGVVDSSPTVDNDILYVGSADEWIYALNITNGQLEWKFQTDGEVLSSPLIANEMLFIGSNDAYLYALNPINGSLEWKYRTGCEIVSSPKTIDAIIYVGSNDHYFYAIGGDSGVTDVDNPYYLGDKILLYCGETLELKEGYNLTAVALDSAGNKAILNLTKNGEVLDEQIISSRDCYFYNRSLDGSNRIILYCPITDIFQGQVDSIVVIENFLQYPEIDSSDTNPTKLLKINEQWDIGNNYSFKFTEMGSLGDKVLCSLLKNNDVVKTCILGENELFVYERKNSTTEDIVTIFEIPILNIFHSSYGDYLQISQNYSMSSDIATVDINQTIVVECGSSMNLNDGCHIKVDEISYNAKALLSLSKDGIIVDQHIVEENDTYQYTRLNDSDESIVTILELNAQNIMYCENTGYISFSPNYSQKSDVNTTDLLGNKIIILYGDSWDLGSGYAIEVNAISVDGDKVWLKITNDDNFVEDEVLIKNNIFEYISPYWGQIGQDWFKFNGTISNMLQGSGMYSYGYVEICPYYTINSNVSYKMGEDDVKVLEQGDVWTVNGYTLTAKEVNISNNSVLLKLDFDGETINEKWLSIDEKFEYNISAYSNDLLLYSVNVNNIFQGTNSNLVQLSDLVIYDLEITASDTVGTSVVIQPVASFSTNVTSGSAPLSVAFVDASTNVTNWYWDFGDGDISLTQNPVHTYTSEGTYTATLMITNESSGIMDTTTTIITVNAPVLIHPVASFTANPTSGNAPLTVNFTDLSTNATHWAWDFGDGGPVTEAHNPVHTFITSGIYTVSLTASDGIESDTVTLTITVDAPVLIHPVASFSANATSGDNPLSVQFIDASINAISWSWNFGDGSTSTEQNPVYTYTSDGTYTVVLTVVNGTESDTIAKMDFITVTTSSSNPPVASFDINVESGAFPLTVFFTDTSTNSPTEWLWDFNDGSTSTEQNPVHTFASTCSYDVTLKATNSDGDDTSDVTTITVYPQAYYTGDRIWDENAGQSTTYSWDARSFSGFFYDLDSGLSSEILVIHDIDRSLGDGDIFYETRPIDVDFEYGDWGSYQMIPFMAEEYFAGYIDDTDINGVDEVSLLSTGYLSTILVDNDEKKSANESSSLELEDGYSLDIVEVDENGNSVYVLLSKDNITLDNAIVSSGDDYVYKVGLGDVDDVATIAVHFNETFTDDGLNGVIIEGVFQISDSYLELNAGSEYCNMEITSISSDLLEMENSNTLLLSKGSTINLMDNINILVADNYDLRFAPYVIVPENETYELRGMVAEETELLTWTPLNFEGFYYDIDEGIQTETLELTSIDDRKIPTGALEYTSTTKSVEFEHSDWGEFNVIGFIAEKYFAGYNGDTDIDGVDDVSLLSKGHLSKLLINDDNSFLLYSGSSLILEEGYKLDITEINGSTYEIVVNLTKNGEEVDRRIVSYSSDYTYSSDIGNNTDVMLIAIHFKDILVNEGKKGVFIEGIFQISDQYITLLAADNYGRMEITSFSDNCIEMENEDSISLSRGAIINITDNMMFRVADSSTLRYYPFVIGGTSSTDYELITPDEDEESDTEPSTPTSSSSSGGGGGGGSGTTGEKYENIAYKDVLSEFVSKDSVTSYEFDDEQNSIEYISFQAFRNWGKISATIEMLHNRSALVDVDAPDTVYYNVNLWVGKSAFSSSENIENSVVGFRVEKEWIEENDIDVDTIRLCRHADGQWTNLNTQKISEDDTYLHFEASTPGFSPFAIVGHSAEKVAVEEVVELKAADSLVESNSDEEDVSTEPISTFNNLVAIGLLSILLIGGIVGYAIYRKRG